MKKFFGRGEAPANPTKEHRRTAALALGAAVIGLALNQLPSNQNTDPDRAVPSATPVVESDSSNGPVDHDLNLVPSQRPLGQVSEMAPGHQLPEVIATPTPQEGSSIPIDPIAPGTHVG